MGARGQDDGRGDVLVCDPTTETRRLIEATLASAGYRVSEAEGADACLQLISEVPPEAFVLNVSGTQFDPLGLTLRVRDLAPDLPVVVLYGPDDDLLVRSLLQAGASDFMSLPVAEPLLLHLVELL